MGTGIDTQILYQDDPTTFWRYPEQEPVTFSFWFLPHNLDYEIESEVKNGNNPDKT